MRSVLRFPVTDDDRGYSYADWRNEWIARGMPWDSSGIEFRVNKSSVQGRCIVTDSTTTGIRTIRLAKVEVAYLTNTVFLPKDLARIIGTAETVDNGAWLLRIDRDIAERFRDEFTNRLAKAGFGSDYEPTREGKLLEDLIDRFAFEN